MLRGGGNGGVKKLTVCVCVCVPGEGVWVVVGRYAALQLCVCLSMSE